MSVEVVEQELPDLNQPPPACEVLIAASRYFADLSSREICGKPSAARVHVVCNACTELEGWRFVCARHLRQYHFGGLWCIYCLACLRE